MELKVLVFSKLLSLLEIICVKPVIVDSMWHIASFIIIRIGSATDLQDQWAVPVTAMW